MRAKVRASLVTMFLKTMRRAVLDDVVCSWGPVAGPVNKSILEGKTLDDMACRAAGMELVEGHNGHFIHLASDHLHIERLYEPDDSGLDPHWEFDFLPNGLRANLVTHAFGSNEEHVVHQPEAKAKARGTAKPRQAKSQPKSKAKSRPKSKAKSQPKSKSKCQPKSKANSHVQASASRH